MFGENEISITGPIIFVQLSPFINEDSGNFTLLKSTRWLFQYSFIDGNNYSHMSHNGKNVKNKIMQNLFIVFCRLMLL